MTDPSGYLEGIYKLLQAGRPVLLGMRNATGKQHWVVVTGFSGGETLKAEAFQIHDPGTNRRANLRQLLDEHPLFYKYFYYP